MGKGVKDTFALTGISSEDRKKYQAMMAKFDTFLRSEKMLLKFFERARFNHQRQGENKSIKQFITSLYHLAESCEYGEIKEEMK